MPERLLTCARPEAPEVALVFFRDIIPEVPIFPRPRRPYRLAVRTPPFHGGNSGSSPDRVAMASVKAPRTFPRLCAAVCGSIPLLALFGCQREACSIQAQCGGLPPKELNELFFREG